ncbi:hypothetical protein [Paramicrobacterium chengjingii]|uniref:DUF4333 domain-containing protein n=1 Tax=Paramicrobacterium chengjingii TaxID=2769067 RepID=A0ABX6YLH4_9MICO|nr:hypothetical protein [Microbacterium chengjingii]QPZ39683.1 hypothetical protein HCR76_06460 [Microbacterium chengjingii]
MSTGLANYQAPKLPKRPGRDGEHWWQGLGKGVWAAGILGIVVIGGGVALSVATANNNADKDRYGNTAEAINYCEDKVRGELKAPSTAEFDSSATGSGTYTVTGTVDSQNSFGAMMRSDFQCTVIIDGETQRTSLDSFEQR